MLGKRQQFYRLVGFYEVKVERHGLGAAVRQYLPSLSPGLSGAAFHGIIHLGYGCSIRSNRVAAEGLAYMHHSFLSLRPALQTPKAEQQQHRRRQQRQQRNYAAEPSAAECAGDEIDFQEFAVRVHAALVAVQSDATLRAVVDIPDIAAKASAAGTGQFQYRMQALASDAAAKATLAAHATSSLQACSPQPSPAAAGKRAAAAAAAAAAAQSAGDVGGEMPAGGMPNTPSFEWIVDVMLDLLLKTSNGKSTVDFFLLHAVTASWAASQAILTAATAAATAVDASSAGGSGIGSSGLPSPSDDDQTVLKEDLVAATLAAYIAQGCPSLSSQIGGGSAAANDDNVGEGQGWGALVAEALEGDKDEHVYKLVAIARDADESSTGCLPSPAYKAVATAVIRKPFWFGPDPGTDSSSGGSGNPTRRPYPTPTTSSDAALHQKKKQKTGPKTDNKRTTPQSQQQQQQQQHDGERRECDVNLLDRKVWKNFSTACKHYGFPGSHQVGSYGPKGTGIVRTYSNGTPGKDLVIGTGDVMLYRLKDEAIRAQFTVNKKTNKLVRVFRKLTRKLNPGVMDLGQFKVDGFVNAGPTDQIEKFGGEFVVFVKVEE